MAFQELSVPGRSRNHQKDKVMNTKERHIKENEKTERQEEELRRNESPNSDLISESLMAEGKMRKRRDTQRINRLWLWLGVIVLVFILLFWLFAIGTFGDLANWFNG